MYKRAIGEAQKQVKFHNSTKKWSRYFGLGCSLMLAAPHLGCETVDKKIEERSRKKEIGTTDGHGNVSFMVDSTTYTLEIKDAVTLQPTPDILVGFVKEPSYAVYVIVDPTNTYVANIINAKPEPTRYSNESGFGIVKSSLVATNATTAYQISVEDALKIGETLLKLGVNGTELPEEIIGDTPEDTKTNLEGLGFSRVNEKPIYLSELASADFLNFLAGELASENLTFVAILLINRVSKELAKILGSSVLSVVLYGLDVAEYASTKNFAKYYKQLCYEDNDTFSIYKFTGFDAWDAGKRKIPEAINSISFLTNPILIIVPDKKPDSWTIPTAAIKGNVEGDTNTSAGLPRSMWGVFQHRDEEILKDAVFIDPTQKTFETAVSTCNNRSGHYYVGISQLGIPVTDVEQHARIQLEFKQTPNDNATHYDLTFVDPFYRDPATLQPCRHQPYYEDLDGDGVGNEYKVRLACEKPEGYVETPGDCDDTDPNLGVRNDQGECRKNLPVDRQIPTYDLNCYIDVLQHSGLGAVSGELSHFTQISGSSNPVFRIGSGVFIYDGVYLLREISGIPQDVVPNITNFGVERRDEIYFYAREGQLHVQTRTGEPIEVTYNDTGIIPQIFEIGRETDAAGFIAKVLGEEGPTIVRIREAAGRTELEDGTHASWWELNTWDGNYGNGIRPFETSVFYNGEPHVAILLQSSPNCVSLCLETGSCRTSCREHEIELLHVSRDRMLFTEKTRDEERNLFSLAATGTQTDSGVFGDFNLDEFELSGARLVSDKVTSVVVNSHEKLDSFIRDGKEAYVIDYLPAPNIPGERFSLYRTINAEEMRAVYPIHKNTQLVFLGPDDPSEVSKIQIRTGMSACGSPWEQVQP